MHHYFIFRSNYKIILFFSILSWACSKEKGQQGIAEVYPKLILTSPKENLSYRADTLVNIEGEIIDIYKIKFLSVKITPNNNSNDTAFFILNQSDSTSVSFNENWQPDSSFNGTSKIFDLEIKVMHDSLNFVPFYQKIKIIK